MRLLRGCENISRGRLSAESGWKNGHGSIVVSTSNPGHGRVNALNGKPAYFLCYDKQY